MGYLIDGCCHCCCTTVAMVSLHHHLHRRRCHRRHHSTTVALATGVTSLSLCCCGTAGHPCHLLSRRCHPCRFPLLSQTDTLNMLNGTETTGISCGESVDTYLGAGRVNWLVDQSNSIGSHMDTSSRHTDVPSVQMDARTAANVPENIRTQRKCYDHTQLRVLSGHSGRIAALQLNSSRSMLTPVALAQISFR